MVTDRLDVPPADIEVLDSPSSPDWKVLPLPLPIEYTGAAVVVPPLPVVVPPLPELEPLLVDEPLVRLPVPLSPPQAVSVRAATPIANIDADVRIFLT
jgi:hypothetical protein